MIAGALILFAAYMVMFKSQGRDFYGNDGCADDRKWPIAEH